MKRLVGEDGKTYVRRDLPPPSQPNRRSDTAKKKIGVSATPPVNAATPLGTSKRSGKDGAAVTPTDPVDPPEDDEDDEDEWKSEWVTMAAVLQEWIEAIDGQLWPPARGEKPPCYDDIMAACDALGGFIEGVKVRVQAWKQPPAKK